MRSMGRSSMSSSAPRSGLARAFGSSRVTRHRATASAAGEWASGSGLEPDPDNTGYGHSPDEVAKVQPRDSAVIVGYHDVVAARTRGYLEQLSAGDLDEIIDRSFQPPVTRGARLVSVAVDDLQHAGQ